MVLFHFRIRWMAVPIAAILIFASLCSHRRTRYAASEQAAGNKLRVWPSDPPESSPFPQSNTIASLALTGRHREYEETDTWFPSWAADGNLYSPYADGWVKGVWSSGGGINTPDKLPAEGAVKIAGDDPLNLQVTPLTLYHTSATPYGGRYPSANLVYNGVWYYGTYALDVPISKEYNCMWCVVGPFIGFGISRDYGRTWQDTRLAPDKNLFQETAKDGRRVRMGMAHFVDFGKNMEYSPDGYAYLVADGALTPGTPAAEALLSAPTWGKYNHTIFKGDMFYLARTKPSPETINDQSAWEFYGGKDVKGSAIWTKAFADMKPLFEWVGHCGGAQVTYDAPLRKYLWFVTDPLEGTGGFVDGLYGVPYSTYLLESDALTGPWKLVTYMRKFGQAAYWVNVPSKFISADGRTAWLCYSANWTRDTKEDPPGSRYGMCLHEINLLPGR